MGCVIDHFGCLLNCYIELLIALENTTSFHFSFGSVIPFWTLEYLPVLEIVRNVLNATIIMYRFISY